MSFVLACFSNGLLDDEGEETTTRVKIGKIWETTA